MGRESLFPPWVEPALVMETSVSMWILSFLNQTPHPPLLQLSFSALAQIIFLVVCSAQR